MNTFKNHTFLVLLISFFVLTSCEKEDNNVSSSLNITLNPGEGLTTADLEGLKLGIVKLPDGTTENDNLDSLIWTSEPTWFIESANTNGTIVFKDIAPGIYLAEIDNDSLQFETFSNDTNAIYIQVENGENTNQTVSIVFSEAENGGTWITAAPNFRGNAAAEELLSVTVRCYNKKNTITKTISSEEEYIYFGRSDEVMGQGHNVKIKDIYKFMGGNCLRDEFYKIEVEIINNNDGTTVTRSVFPKSKSWDSYPSLNENLSVGKLSNNTENEIHKPLLRC